MKRRFGIFTVLVMILIGFIFATTACSIEFEPEYYQLNGKSWTEEELEEHIADLLEVENTDKDIEVRIYQEQDD